jgi:two-component sensor histidine kinase
MLGILGMNIDITDLKEAVEMRDLLINEIHHRVKNNLQMIISIIRLEESDTCHDEEQRAVFSDIINRIEAFSMIHERLYKAGVNNAINVSEYLHGLVEQIVYGSNIKDIELVFDFNVPDIDPNTVITLGLIINEIVTNSLKHAFTGEEPHRLELSLNRSGDVIDVIVSDNGPGLPDGFEVEKCSSLGFLMMITFVEQLGGQLAWDSSPDGCTFSFSFPIKKTET